MKLKLLTILAMALVNASMPIYADYDEGTVAQTSETDSANTTGSSGEIVSDEEETTSLEDQDTSTTPIYDSSDDSDDSSDDF